MRRELLALEPNLVFVENQTMEAEVDATLFPVRAGALLVTVVGGTAMLLAAIGLYGVIAYSVARRTKEIGIRLALGARPASVLSLVMRHGLVVAGVGLAVGCAARRDRRRDDRQRAVRGPRHRSGVVAGRLGAAARRLSHCQPHPGVESRQGRTLASPAHGITRNTDTWIFVYPQV